MKFFSRQMLRILLFVALANCSPKKIPDNSGIIKYPSLESSDVLISQYRAIAILSFAAILRGEYSDNLLDRETNKKLFFGYTFIAWRGLGKNDESRLEILLAKELSSLPYSKENLEIVGLGPLRSADPLCRLDDSMSFVFSNEHLPLSLRSESLLHEEYASLTNEFNLFLNSVYSKWQQIIKADRNAGQNNREGVNRHERKGVR